MRIAAAITIALVALGLSVGTALACSCLRPESATAHLKSAELVFKGVPVAERRLDDVQVETTLRVDEVLKGKAPPRVALRHRLESASCGVVFQRGASVLVIANRAEDGTLRTSLCAQPMFPEADYRRALITPRAAG